MDNLLVLQISHNPNRNLYHMANPYQLEEILNKLSQGLNISLNELYEYHMVFEDADNDYEITACTLTQYMRGEYGPEYDSEDEEETLRLCDFFLSLVERGVQVQVVCMKPFGFYLYAKENCPQLLENPLFELRLNERNHMKLFVFDDECAYIGSANITSAAIGKRANGKRNHEAGMLVWGDEMIEAPLCQFENVWDDPCVLKHTWKRFAKKAKEWEKLF